MSDDLLEDLLNTVDNKGSSEEEDTKLFPLREELILIQDIHIRSFVRALLFNTGAFWKAPASHTEGNCPPDEIMEGGIIKHTKRVVRIARMLALSQERDQHEMDIITAAALLHDVTKCLEADGKYSFDYMYPYTVDRYAQIVARSQEAYQALEGTSSFSSATDIKPDDCAMILRLIRCHMGPWAAIPETYPISQAEWILHFADVLATQLHTIIDGDNVEQWRWIKPESILPKEDEPAE